MDEPRDALQAPSHRDPSPWYRRQPGIGFDPQLRLWVVAGAALVREALLHPALRVRPPAELVPAALVGRPVGEVFERLVRMNDGAFHARHRPDVAAAAGRWDDAAVDEAARAAALDLRGRVDADALLTALPVQAMARLLGVRDLDETVRCVHAFVQGIAAGASPAALDAADRACETLMAQGEAQGLDAARAANRIALMQQALDATAGFIGNAVHLLQRQPDLAAADLQAVVAEVALADPPVHNTRRFAAQALELGGQSIAAGEGLLLLLAAADLPFGAGAHACPGERVALRIAAAALQALQPLDRWFGPVRGWRPLPNARVPLFSPPQGATAWSA
ncbi:MAG: cytochrome P450 [Ramlibacter sp.]